MYRRLMEPFELTTRTILRPLLAKGGQTPAHNTIPRIVFDVFRIQRVASVDGGFAVVEMRSFSEDSDCYEVRGYDEPKPGVN